MTKSQKFLLNLFIIVLLGFVAVGWYNNKKNNSQTNKTDETPQTEKDVDIIINGESTTKTTKNTNNSEEEQKEAEEDKTTEQENNNTEQSADEISLDKFKNIKQILGENSTEKVSIKSYQKEAFDNYYMIQFKLDPEDSNSTDEPKVITQYYNQLGVIRVIFKNVKADQTGLNYQTADTINQKGIIKLYHNISADQTEELYDIGVSQEAPFYVKAKKENSSWIVSVYVKYPGYTQTQDNIDTGSSDFSTTHQVITGAHKDDGATIYSYSYSAQNGILRFVWNVAGSTDKPIPAVEGVNTPTGYVEVQFPSVVKDVIARNPGSMDLPGNIKLTYEMENDTSKYKFKVNSEKEFKLYASTNPNQVILEIKL